MYKIDLKDRKILYELDYNCRQSNTQIGKKVGLKKDVVSYRIDKMEKEGVIEKYYTVIDAYKLGYYLFRYYINFQYVSATIKNEIINYFSQYKNICTVGQAVGKYDLIIVVWVNNLGEFHQFWSESLDKYGDYFENRIFSLYIHGIGFRQSFLMLEKLNTYERENHEVFGVGPIAKIDKIDYSLLNFLSLNARAPLIELAEKLNTSSQTINYRIKRMRKSGVIQTFRVAVDLSRFNLKRYKVDIYLKEYKQRRNIIDFIRKNHYLLYISTSTGLSDLELEFLVKNQEELIVILEEINTEFPNSLRNYSFYGDVKVFKETFLPRIF